MLTWFTSHILAKVEKEIKDAVMGIVNHMSLNKQRTKFLSSGSQQRPDLIFLLLVIKNETILCLLVLFLTEIIFCTTQIGWQI